MRLPRKEQIVRAVCSDKFDRTNGRVSPSLFKGPNPSVNRLTVIPLSLQWRRLAATVQKLSGRRLERLGEIGVGRLEDLGQSMNAADRQPVTLCGRDATLRLDDIAHEVRTRSLIPAPHNRKADLPPGASESGESEIQNGIGPK